jgi:serine-type D-Ala-D-Ala carboxypeptidase/endopeptidase (penicillin-binding protein 4)
VGQALKTELQRAGVRVTGKLEFTPTPPSGMPEAGVATTRSAPLSVLTRSALKRSDNVWTEQVYARLGINTSTPTWRPASPTYAQLQQLQLLKQAGSTDPRLVIQDGSGLSAHNRLTPRALVGLLRYIYLHPLVGTLNPDTPKPGEVDPEVTFKKRQNLLIEALPRAGTGTATPAARLLGGTLARRLKGLDVRAKTGTLPGVSALSGYLITQSGRVLIFSVLMDSYAGPGQQLRQVQDALLRALWQDEAG